MPHLGGSVVCDDFKLQQKVHILTKWTQIDVSRGDKRGHHVAIWCQRIRINWYSQCSADGAKRSSLSYRSAILIRLYIHIASRYTSPAEGALFQAIFSLRSSAANQAFLIQQISPSYRPAIIQSAEHSSQAAMPSPTDASFCPDARAKSNWIEFIIIWVQLSSNLNHCCETDWVFSKQKANELIWVRKLCIRN